MKFDRKDISGTRFPAERSYPVYVRPMTGDSIAYDYVVIGSGFGGSTSAMRLAEKGYSVLVLEKGRRFRSEDFPRSNWNVRKYIWAPLMRCFGFQRIDTFKEVSILSGVGVGGGSLVYANTHMFPTDRFFQSDAWIGRRNWKKTLKPFYDRARFMLGSTRYEKEYAADRILHEVAVDMGREHTYGCVDGVGVYLGPTDVAKDPYFNGLGPARQGCIECAGCMVGCRYNAKNTLDKNYLHFAERFGAHVMAETLAERVEYYDGLYHITVRSSTSWLRRRQTIRARGLIISAGVLGTMRLLLEQKRRGFLPELSDQLGQNVLTNSESLCAIANADQKLNHGLAISRVFNPDEHTHVELCKYPDGSGFMGRLMTLAIDGNHPIIRFFAWFPTVLTSPFRYARFIFSRHFATNSLFLLVMQNIDNAMRLRLRRGIFGLRLRFDNKGENRVPTYIGIGQEVMRRFAKKVGGTALNAVPEVALNTSTTAHILGGCPMGADAASGVVDERFRVHGYPNMYILDGSIIPGNLGVNPSLTITALAEYAISRIPRKKGSKHKTLEQLMKLQSSPSVRSKLVGRRSGAATIRSS